MEKSKLLKKDPDFLYKLDLDAFEIFKCRHAIVRWFRLLGSIAARVYTFFSFLCISRASFLCTGCVWLCIDLWGHHGNIHHQPSLSLTLRKVGAQNWWWAQQTVSGVSTWRRKDRSQVRTYDGVINNWKGTEELYLRTRRTASRQFTKPNRVVGLSDLVACILFPFKHTSSMTPTTKVRGLFIVEQSSINHGTAMPMRYRSLWPPDILYWLRNLLPGLVRARSQ